VHTASFPFFSVLAAGILRRWRGYSLGVDWHEVWTRQYWHDYLGALGMFGWWVQALCARFDQSAYSFSQLHAGRLRQLGREATVLTGEYAGGEFLPEDAATPLTVLYAGRMIPEKRVPFLVQAFALVSKQRPKLRLRIIGKGPEQDAVANEIARLGLQGQAELSGFVDQDELDRAMSDAAVIVLPSMREGYGMVVVEASARGVPSVAVQGPDNAAVELIDDGENGCVAEDNTQALADAIVHVCDHNAEMRQSTVSWYARNAERLSLDSSLRIVSSAVSERNKELAQDNEIRQG